MKPVRLVLSLLIVCAMSMTMAAQTITVYNSIPNPLPPNVGSEGPEAYAFSELGDGVFLSTNSGTIGQVTVIMSSWACQSGTWNGGCVTTPGATFSVPITVNVYSVIDQPSGIYGGNVQTPNHLLGSMTQTFSIPYRPTSNLAQCKDDGTRWYNKKDGTCYHGLATPIVFNLSGYHIQVPTDTRVIVTVSYNTSHYGPAPIGESVPCYKTSAGCPYDSLNISTDTTSGGMSGFVSLPLVPNGIFVNYTNSGNACAGNTVTGYLALDAPTTNPICSWLGYHPEISIQANTNGKHQTKGNAP